MGLRCSEAAVFAFSHFPRAGRFAEEVIKTTNELETVVTIICANQKQMPRRDPLQPYMQIIADTAEQESPVKPSTISQRQVSRVLEGGGLEG
jgi:hypothetical protein